MSTILYSTIAFLIAISIVFILVAIKRTRRSGLGKREESFLSRAAEQGVVWYPL